MFSNSLIYVAKTDCRFYTDPNKKVCHGSNSVRRQKVKSHTDDSEVKSENTEQMTAKIQLQDRKSGTTSQNTTDGSLSQCLFKG